MKRFISYITAFSMLFVLAGCVRELLQDGTDFGKGESKVSLVLDFKPMSVGLERTKAAGDALTDITSLYVLLYDFDSKTLKTSWKIENYSLSDVNRTDGEAENGNSAETATKQAKFTLDKTVAYGKYYMYAVANIDNLLTDYSENIRTIEGLKSLPLTWDSAEISKNAQMMGCVTANGFSSADESIILNKKSTNLHAWLRRAASKVTVAFDASNLNDGIRIHFKSIKIKHIPKTCYLGRDNTPGYTSSTFEETNGKSRDEELHEDGESYYYNGRPDDPDNEAFELWPFVSRGKPIYGLMPSGQIAPGAPKIADYHTENTPALYFYENLQGNEKSKPGIKDKRQDSNSDGKLDAPGLPDDETYCSKDGVEFGTYIEVEAYYDARLSDRPGEGKIIYRFMLGQDVYKDYNARRNCHYKLTLKFNRYANDVDWHIEYREDKELIVPNPYYISYLYNQEATIPIKLKGSNLENVKLEVRIIENHWWPTLEENDTYQYADTSKVEPQGHVREAVWHGFLSLAKDNRKIIGDDKHYKNDKDWNKTEWQSKPENEIRTFDDLRVGNHGNYSVELVEGSNGGLHLKMPFYTRPKQMIPTSGYTGNNVYVAYPREAKLQMRMLDKTTGQILQDKEGNNLIDTISIIQVRRCVNPKGVWRSWDNDESFHVVMKILPREGADKFETYDSKGPWRAKVEVDKNNMIRLKGAGSDGYVHGTIDSPMDFYIDFNGKCADPEEVRSAIVLVEYNNYTCHHRIFVRQGYAPITLNDQNIKWHTFNLYSGTEETESPLEEGSLFKYGNLTDAILAENNKTYGFQKPVGSNTLRLASGEAKSWSNITANTANDAPGFSDKNIQVADVTNPDGPKVSVRVATVDDYKNLRDGADREFGYGVLYGDGATETLEKVDEVYGYYRDGNASYGMRGCFVYNKVNGNNLFFPIGASGYGRRRTEKSWYSSGISLPGALQYAWRSKRYSEYAKGWETLAYRPMFESVYMRPGAVYWCEQLTNGQCYLDINYFTLDFSLGANEPLEGANGSACFIRCVEDVE